MVGFDMSLNYETLTIACRLIDRGVPYVATHPDVRCPIEGGEFIPDCGAMIELIKTATGKAPQQILGYKREEIAMVGDRLSTDIAFGLNNGVLSILVLTGEATLADVEHGSIKPDIILNHASELADYF